jgi:hypothetical protein
MYLVHFEFLKSPKLTNDFLEIEKLGKRIDLGSSYDVTINIDNILSH